MVPVRRNCSNVPNVGMIRPAALSRTRTQVQWEKMGLLDHSAEHHGSVKWIHLILLIGFLSTIYKKTFDEAGSIKSSCYGSSPQFILGELV